MDARTRTSSARDAESAIHGSLLVKRESLFSSLISPDLSLSLSLPPSLSVSSRKRNYLDKRMEPAGQALKVKRDMSASRESHQFSIPVREGKDPPTPSCELCSKRDRSSTIVDARIGAIARVIGIPNAASFRKGTRNFD